MTKAERARQVTWRDELRQFAAATSRSVACACRHFSVSHKTFYQWKLRHVAHRAAGSATVYVPLLHSRRAPPADVVRKIRYPRQQYSSAPGKIADYLTRLPQGRSRGRRCTVRCWQATTTESSTR